MPLIGNIPGPYRFFYSFDCAEPMHVHVRRERNQAKFWLDPVVLAWNRSFGRRELNEIRRIIIDLLIDRPVRKECAVIAAWLIDRGVLPGAEVLDAGCGTGRYALELARRGYAVRGVDLSPELIDHRHACDRRFDRPGLV